MRRLIYEIARPHCSWQEVPRNVFENPPQFPWPPTIEYHKRILVEATPEEIAAVTHELEKSTTETLS